LGWPVKGALRLRVARLALMLNGENLDVLTGEEIEDDVSAVSERHEKLPSVGAKVTDRTPRLGKDAKLEYSAMNGVQRATR
jgi:hypothetical protein